MCGIVGYVGRRPGKPIILDGLRRLEYRGYDSAGIALIESGGIDCVRAVGNLDELFKAAGDNGSDACVGLGHTRWATHGRPTEENAHPHNDCSGRISIVLNGIVENYKDLRARLTERGHTFSSETDAEVVAHLIEEHADEGLPAAVRAALGELEGHYSFVAMSADEPDLLVGTRLETPAGRRRRRRRDVLRLGHPRVFAAHAPDRRARGRRRRHAPRRRRGVHRRRRQRPRARGDGVPRRRRRGREGRLRDVHAQGDPRAAGRPARHARRAAVRGRHRGPLRGRGAGRRVPAPPAAHLHRRLRHLATTRASS